ncbi:VOC family protein [Microbacterium sp. W1N]|uniref:VOC family protein n=1 Tax=Microbacterium festucae TaxID=2977531 RepID=UPI0021C23AD2|nr:VOC family protein [Microbacterium festucae]MCT9820704.1 VOC family protein [Microbacterium festucae]
MNLNPYVNFRGNAREAMEFYRSVLGGELELSDFSGFPDMGIPAGEEHLIMHGQLTTPEGLVLMGSDVPSTMPYDKPAGFAVSVSGDDADRLQQVWDGLAAGGEITLPYETPPWGGKFGMVTDAFGVDWMVALNAA